MGRWFKEGLPPELFRDALARERRRLDRFNQPFVLLLVERNAKRRLGGSSDAVGPDGFESTAIAALRAVGGEVAVVGWLDRHTAGAIVPHTTIRSDYETLVANELRTRIGTAAVSRLAVRAYVAVSPTAAPTATHAPTDPLLADPQPQSVGRQVYFGLKRALDFAGSLALLILLFPVFALVALLVKLTSPGPIIFRQARVGAMGRQFTMLKFRTMRVNADHKVHQAFVQAFINSGAHEQGPDGNATFKLTNDPRITPMGRILRKTSLDELPQLWNVLRGDMSLVGPRPALGYEVEQYRSWHWRRVIEAKPGVTGLWQVYGRSRTTFDDMVRLDIRYARTCSFWNDVKILLATPRAVIMGSGAH